MKIALLITIVTYLFLSYSQAEDEKAVTMSYDHHHMLAAQACPAVTASRKQQKENWTYLKGGSASINMMMLDWHNTGENWTYLKGGSASINMMMLDWHNTGENGFGPIRNI